MYPTTKLTNTEIGRISHDLGIDWDGLAGLVNIPHSEQQEIRFTYPSLSLKAKRVVELYNTSKHFDRRILVRYFEEIGRHDLVKKMLPMKDEVIHDLKFFLAHNANATQPVNQKKIYYVTLRFSTKLHFSMSAVFFLILFYSLFLNFFELRDMAIFFYWFIDKSY